MLTGIRLVFGTYYGEFFFDYKHDVNSKESEDEFIILIKFVD